MSRDEGRGCSPWTTASSLRLLFCGEEGGAGAWTALLLLLSMGKKMQGAGDSRDALACWGRGAPCCCARENEQGASRKPQPRGRRALLLGGRGAGKKGRWEVELQGVAPWERGRRELGVAAGSRPWRSFCAASKAGEVELVSMEEEGQGTCRAVARPHHWSRGGRAPWRGGAGRALSGHGRPLRAGVLLP